MTLAEKHARWERWRLAYLSGKSLRQIADANRVTIPAVGYALQSMNIPLRPRGSPPGFDFARAVEMRAAGASPKDIGRVLGVTAQAIRQRFHREQGKQEARAFAAQ